ncbi:hypothetical protein C943_02941 [Mariniradius saccharolyticus AK6]|uniref:Outer membrane protein beta-barrel domain-containing protein n=1 Tax=Mariniradius saccharolyticus AK6 TaxID=1239962 RepID=M7XJP2_9BACT|nr:outer membrane beta-barrel protein [Mariniradius saccharolyticus]EMS35049.1 hypothetical protein C943_02941 [Mariniradius saccharolyticus AK6]
MNRSFLLLGLLMVLGLKANAQFGIRAGFQSAQTNNDGNQIQGSLPGWYVGAFTEDKLGVTGTLHWHSGLEYLQAGHRQDDLNFRKINYLAVPLGLKISILKLAFLQGGISPSFKVGEKYEVAGANALTQSNKTSVFDLPFHVGAGIKVLIFDIEARYNHGLINVNGGNRNRYLQLGAALRF